MDANERITKIQERAYLRWPERGGSDRVANWLQAEREMEAEENPTTSQAKASRMRRLIPGN
jgi:hypothetical protein